MSSHGSSAPQIKNPIEVARGVELPKGAWTPAAQEILTPAAIAYVAELERAFRERRAGLLREREDRQAQFDAGAVPEYLDKKSEAAAGRWRVATIPGDLQCRRVEITGPANSAKMVINMLSRNADGARADCAMLDFEDSMKPAWQNVIDGVKNVSAAARGDLQFSEDAEKKYRLDPQDMAVMLVRPRGLHLTESNFRVDGQSVSGGLFDLALCFHHSAAALLERGLTPAYYIPKCEHHLEARWWNDLFVEMQRLMQIKAGTLRATFLIETLPAAFQIEEILYEIRDHAAGLNVGRWDKIFSDIKTLKEHPDRVMGDRSSINMSRPWMENYAKRLIKICHARGAFAMGGMAAFTPGKTPELREQQTAKVIEDKKKEAALGHDGCWVSHPYFIGHALSAFGRTNQLDIPGDLPDKYPDLMPQTCGPRTIAGVRTNVRVGIAYMHGWAADIGCIAWDNLMEDLATLEISRAQLWQWLRHGVALDDGTKVDRALLGRIFDEELARIAAELGNAGDARWGAAKDAARELFLTPQFPAFFSFTSDVVE